MQLMIEILRGEMNMRIVGPALTDTVVLLKVLSE